MYEFSEGRKLLIALGGFVILSVFALLGFMKITENESKYWQSLTYLATIEEIQLEVTSFHRSRGGLSFNREISSNVGEMNFKALNDGKEFDWDALNPPFKLIRKLNNDTIVLIKGPKEFKFLFQPD